MHVDILRTMDDAQAFSPTWASLPLANPFASWPFVQAWLAQGAVQPFVMVVKGDDGRLLALAPFCLRKKPAGIRQLEGLCSSDAWYHDPWIADTSVQEAVSDLMIETLKRQRREWDSLDLILTTERSAPLIERLQALGWAFTERPSERQNRLLDFDDSWESYLSSRSKDFRSSLRRAQRKLDELPHRYVAADAQNYRSMLETAIRFSQDRYDPTQERQVWYQCLRDLADWSAPRGALCLYGLEINGRLAAVNAAFRAQDTAYGAVQGYDPAYSEYRVGNLVNAWAYARMVEAGIRRVDLGDGGLPWKERVKTSEAETVLVQIGASLGGRTLLGWKRGVKPLVARLMGRPALCP